jgi:hypothetical protein
MRKAYVQTLRVVVLAPLAVHLAFLEGGGCGTCVSSRFNLIMKAGWIRNVPSVSGTATGLATARAAMVVRRRVMLDFMVTVGEGLVRVEELVGDCGVELNRLSSRIVVSVGEEEGLAHG